MSSWGALRADYPGCLMFSCLPAMANILIVEDEPIAAWSIREALEAAGHNVVNEGSVWDAGYPVCLSE